MDLTWREKNVKTTTTSTLTRVPAVLWMCSQFNQFLKRRQIYLFSLTFWLLHYGNNCCVPSKGRLFVMVFQDICKFCNGYHFWKLKQIKWGKSPTVNAEWCTKGKGKNVHFVMATTFCNGYHILWLLSVVCNPCGNYLEDSLKEGKEWYGFYCGTDFNVDTTLRSGNGGSTFVV